MDDDDEGDAEEEDDEEPDEPEPSGLDLLDVCGMLGSRFGESLEAVLRWSWPLFCARWAKAYELSRRERIERAQSERRIRRRLRRERERAQSATVGGWSSGALDWDD